MSENFYPFNADDPAAPDRYYNADDVAKFDYALFSNGVIAFGNQLQVTAGTGMQTSMNSGFAMVRGRRYENTAAKTFTHDPADGVLNRIDRIVIKQSVTNRNVTSYVLKGTAGASPTAPALTRTSDAYEIAVADVLISAGVTSITSEKITDKRLDNTVCGMVSANITIDLTATNSQITALIAHLTTAIGEAEGGAAYDLKPIRVENLTIATTDFVAYTAAAEAETRIYNAGYTKRAAVPITGSLSNMHPHLDFDVPSVESSGARIINSYQPYNGGVYVYADAVPTSDVIILTADIRKAVS